MMMMVIKYNISSFMKFSQVNKNIQIIKFYEKCYKVISFVKKFKVMKKIQSYQFYEIFTSYKKIYKVMKNFTKLFVV